MTAPTEPSPFTARDIELLSARGIVDEEARRQLLQLRRPPPALALDRPCTTGDGIDTFDADTRARLARRHVTAAAAGRVCAFVPASGAASRMFKELLECEQSSRAWSRAEVEAAALESTNAKALLTFVDGLDRFAFRDVLARALAERGERYEALRSEGPYRPVLEALLEPDALNYAALPKALILFHLEHGVPRTAFEEHLVEAAALHRDGDGVVRVHVTVPASHRRRFEAVGDRFEAGAGTTFRIDYSVQDPATDTLAIDSGGSPFRDDVGSLLLRPAGHGALIANLALAPAPVVMIKNIDNIAASPYREPTLEWTRAIVGRTLELRDDVHALVRRLRDERDRTAVADAMTWLERAGLGGDASAGRAALIAALDRPIRVCGMVVNTGEPGGGPFWVRGRDGRTSRQIVESAQIDASNPAQVAVMNASTHFNPVYLACALDDADGRRHDLARYVDLDAAIVTRRSAGGRELVALERPGLWNGGMAHWITQFIEVPLAVFNPVKTVNDLLRREHQGD